jgi:hypothetical protein
MWDLQAQTSVVRLLLGIEVMHPEVIAPSFSTVTLVQVCVVYSTGIEEPQSWWETSESPEPFKMVLSYEGVKWIELSAYGKMEGLCYHSKVNGVQFKPDPRRRANNSRAFPHIMYV